MTVGDAFDGRGANWEVREALWPAASDSPDGTSPSATTARAHRATVPVRRTTAWGLIWRAISQG